MTTVLIIEDNEKNLRLTNDVLEFAGFDTLQSSTAEEGLELARSHRPDVILMDVQLPGMDGESALRVLRADPRTAGIPVAAVTAFALSSDRRRLLASGFDAYIPKPIEITQLPDQVRELCGSRSRSPFAPDEGGAGITTEVATILVVDDTAANVRTLEAILGGAGYRTLSAVDGASALETIERESIDAVLLDLHLPDMTGLDVCRLLRERAPDRILPIVLVTSRDGASTADAIDAGAGDFIQRPFAHAELLARVASHVRIKRLHDVVERQRLELATQSDDLQRRVDEQVVELDRLRRLRRFLAPHVADALSAAVEDGLLEPHRAEIAVMFCDLRGFTEFSVNVEPEELVRTMRAYHAFVGHVVHDRGATVGHLAGDGILVWFNDPVPVQDPALEAVRLALMVSEGTEDLRQEWARLGYELGIGTGITYGFATLGTVGFEDRSEYTALGSVVNRAARLSGAAAGGEILLDRRAFSAVADHVVAEPRPAVQAKGFNEPVEAWAVSALRGPV